MPKKVKGDELLEVDILAFPGGRCQTSLETLGSKLDVYALELPRLGREQQMDRLKAWHRVVQLARVGTPSFLSQKRLLRSHQLEQQANLTHIWGTQVHRK